jgi:lipopolysaccharide/colanic/teichoic acid biosynthesis glycosyltransferase
VALTTPAPRPGFDAVPYRGKRALDLVIVVLAAVPTAVVVGLAALAVRLTSRGPAIFRQERIGQWGEPFVVWKLRTMIDDDNPVLPDEDRITPVGRILRRASIDELPQLVQVALGTMSIVGPRPTLGYQVERYDRAQRQRLCVKPGLTGLAQIRGRNEIRWAERIEHDLEYVTRQSLALDLRILVASVATVLGGAGHEGHPVDDPLAAPPHAPAPPGPTSDPVDDGA